MKNIFKKIKINYLTYFLFLICLLSGMFKNIIIVFLIILIHELGHVYFINLYNYDIKKIEIFPFGGITKIEKDLNNPINHDLVIAFGGILFQFLLWIVILFLLNNNLITNLTYNIFFKYNSAIMLFNLLPIIPLDGYIILKSILEKIFSFKKAQIIIIVISVIGIIFYVQYNYIYSINNYMIVFLLIYKTYDTLKNSNYIYNRFLLERYINTYPYKKIKEEKSISLQRFKRETLHFFKVGNRYVHEKEILKKKFDKNRHF